MLAHLRARLFSLLADCVSSAMLLAAGFIGLLDGKCLEEARIERDELEKAAESGMSFARDYWKKHDVSYPISPDKVQLELAKARKHEGSLQRWRKTAIAVLMVVGIFFFFFARYLQTLGM